MTPLEFLASPPTEITKYPAPVLLATAELITDLTPWEEIGEIMYALMIMNRGAGLAAPQVGLSYRAFIIGTGKTPLTVINPEILEYGDQKVKMIEGCLSIPGVMVEVERSKKVKVKWTDEKGKERKETFDGMTARCFQHEFDHLDGKLINRAEDTPRFPHKAIWCVSGADIPVTVVGILGEYEGEEFYAVEGSGTGIPARQLKNLAGTPKYGRTTKAEPECPSSENL